MTLTTVPDCAHASTTEKVVAPTCTEVGRTDTVCSSCGKVISTVAGDPATGHINTTTTTVDATCTVAGSTTVTCDDCDAIISTETIPTIAHTDVNTDNDHNCDFCGAENVTDHVDSDGDTVCDNGCGETISGTTPEPDPEPETPVENTESLNIYGTTGTLAGDKSNIQWTGNNFTVINTKTSNSNAIRNSDSDHYRAYANSKLTIAVNNGTITKVVITCTSSSYANVMITSATNAGYTATVSGSVVTITVESVESITFTASAQTRLNKVEVTYTK